MQLARLALIGGPGAGKSAVALALAARLAAPAIDVDADLAAGADPAHAFVDAGEAAYRDRERAATLAALQQSGAVVAVPSGAPADPAVAAALAGVRTVWLRVDVGTALRRLGLHDSSARLPGIRAALVRALAERERAYAGVAHATVDTRGRDLAAVTDAVAGLLA